ncbi:MAG: GIY-YIG nuclease family protein [bacterium]
MYYVYILKSVNFNRYYIGYTSGLSRRLFEHNNGNTPSLRKYLPYEIIHTEEYENKGDAMKREKEIKSYKGGNSFKRLIQQPLL